MKRKDVDQVSHDFSDFSLSSPARKIRRLDAELPPIIEEEETEIRPAVFEESMEEQLPPPLVPQKSLSFQNQDKAIVLFKPINSYIPQPSSNFSINLDSHVISDFRNPFVWSSQCDHRKLSEEEAGTRNKAAKDCNAIVPWIASQVPIVQAMDTVQTEAPELITAEEMGEEAMDIEDCSRESIGQEHLYEFGGMRGNDGLPHWHQQHCIIPQFPQNTCTPVTWFRDE